MANNIRLEYASKTDTGRIRSQNEDAIALSPSHGFAVLADGMGGYNAGEVASFIATAVFKASMEHGLDQLQSPSLDILTTRGKQVQQLMVESVQRANSAILEAALSEPQYHGMGTTLVAALFQGDRIYLAHVGDSRVYRFRQGELVQTTRDHSLLQEQIDAGLIAPEWARFVQHKNLVTRALGIGPKMEVEVQDYHIEVGDIYLLCSDGLSEMLSTQEIRDILLSSADMLEYACKILVEKANDNGGLDNTSVVLIKVQSNGTSRKGMLTRIRSWLTNLVFRCD
jgi:protein phosphatase